MIFKSIEHILKELEVAGRIKRFAPIMDPDETESRCLWMSSALYDWVYQKDRKVTEGFKPNLRAYLGRYVKGEEIDNRDYMKSWKKNVFELRVQLETRRENTRIFGAFCAPDTFLATHHYWRSKFGGMYDPKWDEAIDRVIDKWDELIPDHQPISVNPFSGCVTFGGVDCDAN